MLIDDSTPRYINVVTRAGDVDHEITKECAEWLNERNAVYPCGDGTYLHDLHLNPEHTFTLEEVECIISGFPPSRVDDREGVA